jgi:hypothetical protein
MLGCGCICHADAGSPTCQWGFDGGCAKDYEQGTLSDDSTVPGQPVMVLLDMDGEEGVSKGFDGSGNVQVMERLPHPANRKRFKIFVVTSLDNDFSLFCFQLIGQGSPFCTVHNCMTSHHHVSIKTVKPGKIHFTKSLTARFIMPSLTKSAIDQHVLSVDSL